ncbi:MAG: hypothetical protein ABIF82_10535 [Planctomycetota bacterium]
MRKCVKSLAFVLAAAVLASGAVAAAADEAPVNALARWIPAESLLFIGYDGSNPAAKKTALYELLQDPEMKALLDGPLAALKNVISAEALKKGELGTDVLVPLLNTKIGVAFVGLAPPAGENMPPQPEVLLVIEVGEPDSATAKAARLLVDHILKKAGLAPDAFKPAKAGEIDVRTARIDEGAMSYAIARGHFVLGTANALVKAFDNATTKLADTKEFQRVSQVTGGSEVVVLHFAYASFIQKFGVFIPRDVSKVLLDPAFGLVNLRSVSAALAPDGKGFRTSVFVRVQGERKGIMNLMAGKSLDPAIVELAPKDTECFFATSLDPGALWDFVVANAIKTPAEREKFDENIAEANEKLGFDLRKDFVGSLGDEYALFGPGFIGVAKLKDPVKFGACFNAMMVKLAEAVREGEGDRDLRDAELRLASMEYGGRKITYVDGRRFPLLIQPCYTMAGDYAVFALFPASLKSYILKMKGGETFVDNDEFKALRPKLGPRPASIYYADTAGFVRELYGYLPMAAGLMKMAPEKLQALVPDPAKIPPFETVSKHLFGCVAGRRPVEDGILWQSYSPFGLPTPPAFTQGGGVATTAIMAGMLMPALGRARGEARKVAGMSNLKQIGVATHLWLNKHGDQQFFPPSLKSLWDNEIVREPRVFLHPASGTKPVPGKFVTDYECILDLVGGKVGEAEAPGSLPLAWDKRPFSPGGRNVVFIDSHVEFVREARFRRLKKDVIDPWIAKHKGKPKADLKKKPDVVDDPFEGL